MLSVATYTFSRCIFDTHFIMAMLVGELISPPLEFQFPDHWAAVRLYRLRAVREQTSHPPSPRLYICNKISGWVDPHPPPPGGNRKPCGFLVGSCNPRSPGPTDLVACVGLLDICVALIYQLCNEAYVCLPHTCRWLTLSSTELCGKSCLGDYCRVNLARLWKASTFYVGSVGISKHLIEFEWTRLDHFRRNLLAWLPLKSPFRNICNNGYSQAGWSSTGWSSYYVWEQVFNRATQQVFKIILSKCSIELLSKCSANEFLIEKASAKQCSGGRLEGASHLRMTIELLFSLISNTSCPLLTRASIFLLLCTALKLLFWKIISSNALHYANIHAGKLLGMASEQ